MAKPTVGFIGAGHIGSQVARLAISCGYPVVISNSRGPETLAALVGELGPRARAATAVDAAKASEIVVVSIPLKNYGSSTRSMKPCRIGTSPRTCSSVRRSGLRSWK